ncbi:hypothetical protein K493DRAFT_315011 [Basidiobolus meristosporus CBS 931.73]|uniref:CREG-like beta-barrel domain-containing protein n=1 Tax=Basidiobolus meristosporus CBS 931.73 TaxID=1314790 RepID=A0A1Y1YBS1_9FUNG|nr:hypothetical protein K493DRAFT_315011 [Basidiobolus meristosporus CBS 931.73]|eukprot:ORX95428.1 hypothetical protein K493DRAFT_315011 [Basidiobolus meristosporus CBS 931.73]
MGTLITTYPDGQPFGSVDYFADDCPSNGDPVLYLSSMQVTVRNFHQSPRAALAIQTQLNSTSQSPMPHARFTLMGEIRPIPAEELNRRSQELRECFYNKHPEARRWPRGHDFRFYRLHVDRIYWIGGFGGFHYIGPISPEVYHRTDPSVAQGSFLNHVRDQIRFGLRSRFE